MQIVYSRRELIVNRKRRDVRINRLYWLIDLKLKINVQKRMLSWEPIARRKAIEEATFSSNKHRNEPRSKRGCIWWKGWVSDAATVSQCEEFLWLTDWELFIYFIMLSFMRHPLLLLHPPRINVIPSSYSSAFALSSLIIFINRFRFSTIYPLLLLWLLLRSPAYAPTFFDSYH